MIFFNPASTFAFPLRLGGVQYMVTCLFYVPQLEAMGFDRAIVLEVFFACNKNEELAANYLLDHMHEFED